MKFQDSLLLWYDEHKRDLPWRKTRDPYRVLVAEIMLQQTQVSRVLPIYNAFIKKFPSFKALSEASLGEVLTAWKGLGYNRRARYLWQLSRNLPYGKLPKTREELLKLPGIGHYTSESILAFAFNVPASAVDTNVRKIYHRKFRNTDATFIRANVPQGRSRDWHNALMDLGSTICTKNPQCASCPIRTHCKARQENDFTFTVPKQSTYKDSNRYYRGKILDVLRGGPATKVKLNALGAKEKIATALASLEKDSLVKKTNRVYSI